MKVLVVGASRGIGLELVRQYRDAGAAVTASARDDAGLERLRALGATAFRLDVADAASASGLAWQIDGAGFDVAVVNAGVGGPRSAGLATPTADDFDAVMRTNVLGPMRVLPQIVEALGPGGAIAVLSSRMGSIGSRTAAGMSLYRASKAAVNSVVKDASLTYAGPCRLHQRAPRLGPHRHGRLGCGHRRGHQRRRPAPRHRRADAARQRLVLQLRRAGDSLVTAVHAA